MHRYDRKYVLRQSKASMRRLRSSTVVRRPPDACSSTPAPERRGDDNLRETVDGIVDAWLAENPHENYELVVAHTHGHSDHVAGDAQFSERPSTVVVDRELPAVQAFYGFESWPKGSSATTSAAGCSR